MLRIKKSDTATVFTTSAESPSTILEFLQSHNIGVLATTNSGGSPHTTAVYYSVDSDFIITFATKSDTQKYENISRAPTVSLLVFDSESQTTVQITGTAKIADDEAVLSKTLSRMVESAEQSSTEGVPPLSKLYAGHYVAVQIIPDIIRMALFLRPDPGGYDIFETIEFQHE